MLRRDPPRSIPSSCSRQSGGDRRVLGLELGGTITSPSLQPRELVLRVKKILERGRATEPGKKRAIWRIAHRSPRHV